MQSKLLLPLALVVAASLATVAWWTWRDDGTEGDDPVAYDADGEPIGEREQQRRRRGELAAQARNLSFEERDVPGLGAIASNDPASASLGTIDRRGAEDGFDHIMRALEDLAEDRERLDKGEWRELYRAANDAFSALSTQLDANDPADREQLEQAHRRLQDGLRRVRVRGRKFAPQ